ncbi:MAG: trypsin-like peptidase domain-containing protein [Anaerolineae bacterium]|nr:trypsin-like peptidase domain-containing protein [Anaerolineae bacterium]
MRAKSRLVLVIGALVALSLGCLAVPTVTRQVETTAVPTATVVSPSAPVVVIPPDTALENLQTQVEAVYAATGDSVVNIAVTTIGTDFFFNPVQQEGTGSGFVYDGLGHIITNFHVVDGAEEINVTFKDGTTIMAEVVGEDPTYDLAVVKVDPDAYPMHPLSLGDSEFLRIGQFVVAIGAPFGLDQSLTFGVISSLGRIIESPDRRYIGEAIQTDAAINPGNSGGPLLDLEGRVIGVNAQIVSPSQANAGIGFAIPARLVRRVAPQLIESGVYRHPWMGVGPVGLTPQLTEISRDAGYDVPEVGVLIMTVERNSAADRAGLRGAQQQVSTRWGDVPVGGDVILSFDGTPITDSRDLIAYLETFTQPGDTVEVEIYRAGEILELSVTLGERPIP